MRFLTSRARQLVKFDMNNRQELYMNDCQQESLSGPAPAATEEDAGFPLTDLQQAYWIGEQDIYRLRTPAVLYRSFFTSALDLPRLEDALSAVARTHPSLCVDILADGTQRYAPCPERVAVSFQDWRGRPRQTEKDFLSSRKKALEENPPPLGKGLQFSCFADRVDEGFYVHLLFRLIAFDAQSVMLFLDDLTAAYLGIRPPQKPGADFKDFIHRRRSVKDSPAWQRSLQYWQERIGDMPNAPDLPIVDHDKIPETSHFRRMQICMNPEQASHLYAQARKCGVTINALLCTAYTDVLRLWSRNASFTLNLLISQRPGVSAGFSRVIGNFGNTMLLEVSVNSGGFQERAKALQRQMYRDIEHAQVSGVEVIRAMKRGADSLPAMPVVFASSLGLDIGKNIHSPYEMGWTVKDGGLHTPQVWLDCQVYMDGDQLVLNWDFAEDMLMPGVIEEMFAVFKEHLDAIRRASFSEGDLLLPMLPQPFLAARISANNTEKALPQGLLQDFFAQACREHAEKEAIISSDRVICYADLWRLTTRLAARLRQSGVSRNDLVAILAHRGWRQVAAAVSVVQSGGAYLPVSSDLPAARQEYLIGQQGVKALLAERSLLKELVVPDGVDVLVLEDVLPDGAPGEAAALETCQTEHDLAYVIFTSGSTGQPKGVAIDHCGAVNTIQDVIARFGLTSDDRVIGISAFNFDLSVYDIFATLGCGATLVLPPYSETPAPEDWARCVREHKVTVWNTVPALLEMQIEYSSAQAAKDLASLRLVMLSGDWIPVSLPGRLATMVPQAVLVSLGGATEASIWSNYFVVDHVDPSWKSIPYGWPLSNQTFHVLNSNLQPAPTWVAGDLYIGGIGLAQGYYKDLKRTADSFIHHPQTGERLYRTGDTGRYHASGHLEFLGRNDNQVKIRGFRIELGEIDTTLERCAGVRSGATIVRTVGERDRQLVAFYVPDKTGCDEKSIRAHLEKTLPEYMVPALFVEIEQMPVTANGKVDRKTLLSLAEKLAISTKIKAAPRNEIEEKLAGIWKALLDTDAPGVQDNFFELGGTSLLAVRLVNAIAREFGRQLPLASLLRHGTIEAQAALLQDALASTAHSVARNPVVVMREGEEGVLLAVHPVGGNVLCYRNLVDMVPSGIAVIGLQSPGDGRPRTISELSASYVNAVRSQLRHRKPVYLFGWSLGGVVAHEMARLLESMDIAVANLTMVDSWTGAAGETNAAPSLEGYPLIANFVKDFMDGAPLPARLSEMEAMEDNKRIDAAIRLLRELDSVGGHLSREDFAALLAEHRANYNALIRHRPGKVHVAVHQFRASRTQAFPHLQPFGSTGSERNVSITLDEDHFSISRGASLRQIVACVFAPGKHDATASPSLSM